MVRLDKELAVIKAQIDPLGWMGSSSPASSR
jgi:hypothetical protein